MDEDRKLTKNEKISLAMTGRTLSPEHKQKLALAKKGTVRTAATREKIKNTLLGNKRNTTKKTKKTIHSFPKQVKAARS